MEDLRVLIFFYLVESFLMVFCGFRLFKVQQRTHILIIISIIYGLAIYFVRGLYIYFNYPFGTHTLILALIFLLLVMTIGKINFSLSVGITLLSFCLMLIGGSLSAIVVQQFNLNPIDILNNPWLHVAVGNSENVMLLIALICSYVFNFSIIGNSA